MKKLILALILAVLIFRQDAPPVVASSYSGSSASPAACVANYTPVGSYCIRTTWNDGGHALGIGTSCTPVNLATLTGIPATAKIIWINVETAMYASGGDASGGQWSSAYAFYTDAGCTADISHVIGPSQSQAQHGAVWQYTGTVTSAGFAYDSYATIPLFINGVTLIYAKATVSALTHQAVTNTIQEIPMYAQ